MFHLLIHFVPDLKRNKIERTGHLSHYNCQWPEKEPIMNTGSGLLSIAESLHASLFCILELFSEGVC